MDNERMIKVIYTLVSELCDKKNLTDAENEFLEMMDELTDTIIKP